MEPAPATLTAARADNTGADRDPAPGRRPSRVRWVWASLRPETSIDRTPSPPTLETFFNLVG